MRRAVVVLTLLLRVLILSVSVRADDDPPKCVPGVLARG
jgi:hypothetical protein